MVTHWAGVGSFEGLSFRLRQFFLAAPSAERAMLAALDGSCRTPIAGLAQRDGDRLTLEGLLLKPDGSGEVRSRCAGAIAAATALGAALGKELRSRAGPGFGLA